MKVAIYTLGCKVNQYETQAMEQTLRAKGHQVVEFSDEADAYVVNTCSVTAVSDQKSRQVIHGVQRKHPGAVVAVCGCYPQTHPEDVKNLDGLILNMATRIKVNLGGTSITTVDAALNVLTNTGVINSPDYWASKYTALAWLDVLLISAANALTE